MATIRTRIIDAVITALNGAGKPSGLKVERFRTTTQEVSELPAMIVYPLDEQVQRATESKRSPLVERHLRLRVKCRAKSGSSQTIDQALDDLTAWATAALLADKSQGNLAIDTQESSIEWDATSGAVEESGAAYIEFLIRYSTKTEDQTARA